MKAAAEFIAANSNTETENELLYEKFVSEKKDLMVLKLESIGGPSITNVEEVSKALSLLNAVETRLRKGLIYLDVSGLETLLEEVGWDIANLGLAAELCESKKGRNYTKDDLKDNIDAVKEGRYLELET